MPYHATRQTVSDADSYFVSYDLRYLNARVRVHQRVYSPFLYCARRCEPWMLSRSATKHVLQPRCTEICSNKLFKQIEFAQSVLPAASHPRCDLTF